MNPSQGQVGKDWEKLFSKDHQLYRVESTSKDFFQHCRNSTWVKEILSRGVPGAISPDARVLEAGCANAKRAIAISTYGPLCVGIDYARAMCEAAARLSQQARRLWESSRSGIVQGDILSLPFKDDAFDLVFNNGVLEHFLGHGERNRVLSEMVRVTRPSGRILVTVPNGQHLLEGFWHRHLLHEEAIQEVTLSKHDLERELKEAGIRVVWSGYLGVSDSFEQWLKYRILKFPISVSDIFIRKFFPRAIQKFLAFHVICVGRKA